MHLIVGEDIILPHAIRNVCVRGHDHKPLTGGRIISSPTAIPLRIFLVIGIYYIAKQEQETIE